MNRLPITAAEDAPQNSQMLPAVRRRRRGRILRAAADVFYEQGLHQATMSDIAVRLKTSKVGICRYFSTKDELIIAICQDVTAHCIVTDEDSTVDLSDFLRRSLELARANVSGFILASRLAAYHPGYAAYSASMRDSFNSRAREHFGCLHQLTDHFPGVSEAAARGSVDFIFETLSYWVQAGYSERDKEWLIWCAEAARAIARRGSL